MRQNWKISLTSRVSARSWRIGLDRDISDELHKSAVVELKLSLGHDCLEDHLHRIGIFESSKYPLCKKDEVMDRNHLCWDARFCTETPM
ncbi:uncharacterized protein TNCT_294981 [Trichonephila clavata]|uniref:Uncharacterized protein n=1 Tax=Trichonephila clavata TaxID=2740835 RepID=A0A8X6G6E6_TRICU|nr:uncharacterized protein TNCT_294981 [Trichonephila clavata]